MFKTFSDSNTQFKKRRWEKYTIYTLIASSATLTHCYILSLPSWKLLSCVQLFVTPWNSPWNSPGQNTRVGSYSLLQGIFPTQGSVPGLLQCGKTWVRSLGWEDPLEEETDTVSSILTWRIPWTIPWGRQELDMTERLSPSLFTLNDCYVYLFVCFAFN